LTRSANLTSWTCRTVTLLVLCAAAGSFGCAHKAPDLMPVAQAPAWPPAPEPARIRFVQSVQVPEDLGIRKGFAVRIFRRIVHGRMTRNMARPYAVSVAPNGVIAVADPDSRSVHLFDTPGSRYHRVVKAGHEALLSPVGVVFDSENRLYVADSQRKVVDRFGADGKWIDMFIQDDRLQRPTGLAFDSNRKILWVVDTKSHQVAGYDQHGEREVAHGRRGEGDGEFNYPVGVALDSTGRLFITDSMNFRVQVLDPVGGFLYAFGKGGRGPGEFDKVKGIALDQDGHVYVVEGLHDVIHVYDLEGQLLTIVGGTGVEAGRFGLPAGIHISADGKIFVADSANHRIQILQYLGDPATVVPES
jgi:DNA-binding beta-propeller fold protein YncE